MDFCGDVDDDKKMDIFLCKSKIIFNFALLNFVVLFNENY